MTVLAFYARKNTLTPNLIQGAAILIALAVLNERASRDALKSALETSTASEQAMLNEVPYRGTVQAVQDMLERCAR